MQICWLMLKCKHALINYSWIIQKRRERSRKSRNAWKALTSSNSRIEAKTYRLCLSNLVKKLQLWYIPERRRSFTSRSAEVIITSSISLLSVANMIKIVVCHCFAQGSKFGQIPLYSQFGAGWQIWSKQ